MAETRPLVNGRLTTWLNIGPDGFFGLMGVDESEVRYITFQIQFNDDASLFVRHGSTLIRVPEFTYPQDQWFKLDIEFILPDMLGMGLHVHRSGLSFRTLG